MTSFPTECSQSRHNLFPTESGEMAVPLQRSHGQEGGGCYGSAPPCPPGFTLGARGADAAGAEDPGPREASGVPTSQPVAGEARKTAGSLLSVGLPSRPLGMSGMPAAPRGLELPEAHPPDVSRWPWRIYSVDHGWNSPKLDGQDCLLPYSHHSAFPSSALWGTTALPPSFLDPLPSFNTHYCPQVRFLYFSCPKHMTKAFHDLHAQYLPLVIKRGLPSWKGRGLSTGWVWGVGRGCRGHPSRPGDGVAPP